MNRHPPGLKVSTAPVDGSGMGKNKSTKGTPAAALLAGGLHDFSRYEKYRPSKVYGDIFADTAPPQPMIELDDAIVDGAIEAMRRSAAWATFAADLEWAAKALRRGDVLRWKTATFAAVRHLNVALGSR